MAWLPFWLDDWELSDTVPSTTTLQIADDAVWSWFNDPHVICQRTPAGTNWTHVGYVDSAGSTKVTSVDLDGGDTFESTLHATLEVDDHDPVSLVEMADGTLFGTYSQHTGSGFWWRRTTDPEDPTSWGSETNVTTAALGGGLTDVAYPKPVLFASGRLFIIFRRNTQAQYFVYSDNDGSSWSSPQPLIVNSTQRPYINLCYDPVGDRVDLIFTESHPQIGSPSIYHVTLDSAGNVRKSDGTLIRNAITTGSVAPGEATQIYDGTGGGGKAWGWDVCRDPADNTKIVAAFARFPTDDDHRYCYATWNGSSWTVTTDVLGATAGMTLYGRSGSLEPWYSGGVAIDRTDVASVYVSKQTSSSWEVERWGPHAAGDFAGTGTSVTSSSTPGFKNIRPVSPRYPEKLVRPGWAPRVVWPAGTYTGYTIYDMVLRLQVEPDATVYVDGTATESDSHTDTVSGTVPVSGSLTDLHRYTDTVTGTVVLSGSIVDLHQFTNTVTGTVTVTGTSTATFAHSAAVTGTVTVAGSRTEALSHSPTVAGTVTVTGLRTDAYSHSRSVTGTTTVTGSATSIRTFFDVRSGTTPLAGTCTESRAYTELPIGDVTVTGLLVEVWDPPAPLLDLLFVLSVDPHQRTAAVEAHPRLVQVEAHPRSLQVLATSKVLLVDPHTRTASVDPHERRLGVDG